MATTGHQPGDVRRLVVCSPWLFVYALSVVLFLTPYTLLSGRYLNGYEYGLGVVGLATWTGAVATAVALLIV